jgi:hypothetical protein
MLAAHRCGGRTDFLGFARAWDRFAGAGRRARRASDREVLVLRSHLEASLLSEGPNVELGQALADHRALVARREPDAAPGPRPGEPNRAPELRKHHGWAWLRVFRRLDDYERALARLEAEQAEQAGAAEREHEPV